MAVIGVLLFHGVEELDFAGPWEVFSASKMLQKEDGVTGDKLWDVVTIASSKLSPVICSKVCCVLHLMG